MAETRQHNGYDILLRDDWLFDVSKDGLLLRADFKSMSDAIDFADRHAAREHTPTDWPKFDVLNDEGNLVKLRGVKGKDGSLIFDPDRAEPTPVLFPDTPEVKDALRKYHRAQNEADALREALRPLGTRYQPNPIDPEPARQAYERLIKRIEDKAALPPPVVP